jgi:SAM-dependent methyltransferase
MDRLEDVSEAWERNAVEWLAWARTPAHDAYHWRFNFPQFTELLPETPRTVLDVGCGEGRVGRWLAGRRHTVFGIDSSPTLTAAAREAGGYEEIVCGDAARLPWPDNRFDLVVAYMSLHDMPDPEPVIGEIARVLRPASPLAIAIVHPLNRADEDLARYFETLRFCEQVIRDELAMTFDGVNRPLSDYTGALSRNGFVIDRLTEPRPSAEDCRDDPSLIRAARRAYFLHIRCFQPGYRVQGHATAGELTES